MEFSFNINQILPDEITIITSSFSNLQKFQRSSYDSHRNNLVQIIDNMGIASAKAQSLPMPITSFKRLQYSDHKLYILKDGFANNMQGAVVGILKMGSKKLFVYDMLGKQHELEPLCVLDFYVHESRQRHGYGKVLFEFMLQHEGVKPVHLAIDRPSVKFAGFLKKHYGLKDCIPQMNNFVVFHGFFRDRTDSGAAAASRGGRNGADRQHSSTRPPAHPLSSPTKRPPSSTLNDRKSLLPTPRQSPSPRQSTPRRQRPGHVAVPVELQAAPSPVAEPRVTGLPPRASIGPPQPPQQPQTHSAPPAAPRLPEQPEALVATRDLRYPSNGAPAAGSRESANSRPQQVGGSGALGSLGRSPSLNRLAWQQQPQQKQQQQPPAVTLPGLTSQSRTRSNPNLANPALYGGVGGGDGSGEVALKSRYFTPSAAAAAAASSPYDYQQGLRRHYSHTRLW